MRVILKSFKFKLRGRVWNVKFRTRKWITQEMGPHVYGFTEYQDCHIYLDKELSLATIRETFWHEFVHAALSLFIGTPDIVDGRVSEETTCNTISASLLEMFGQKDSIPHFLFQGESIKQSVEFSNTRSLEK